MKQYVKTVWKDRQVEYPNRYTNQDNEVVTLTRAPGEIQEEGTKVNAEKLNNIENGIQELYNNFPSPIVIDSALSATSENPVQNKVIKVELDKKIESVPVASDTTYGTIKIGFDETTSTLSINTTETSVVEDAT